MICASTRKVLPHNIQKAKENNIITRPSPRCRIRSDPREDQSEADQDRPVGRRSRQPVPHFVGTMRPRRRRPVQHVPNHVEIPSSSPACPAASSQCPASGSRPAAIRSALPSAAWLRVRDRPVRCHLSSCRLALHRQLLPRRRLQLQAAGLRARGDPAAGYVQERFDWLKIAGQIIATPGCESNVEEIFDKTWELGRIRP